MKHSLTYLALLTLTIACQDDTKQLLNSIDGRWQIKALTYQRATGPDSVVLVTNTQTFLTFEPCTSALNNSGPTHCGVEYSSGGQLFKFSYQAPNGKQSLYISPLNLPHDPVYKVIAEQLSGSYEVVTLDGTNLVIRHPLQGVLPGYTHVEYAASK